MFRILWFPFFVIFRLRPLRASLSSEVPRSVGKPWDNRLTRLQELLGLHRAQVTMANPCNVVRIGLGGHRTAALAVSRWIETTTGWSIRNFVRTARRYRTIEIQAGEHTITAADPLPDDLSEALDRIHYGSSAH